MPKIEHFRFDTTYYPVAVVSCSAFLSLYKYVSPAISSRLCPGYTLLPPAKQIDWNTRVQSSVHAMIVSFMCAYSFVYDTEIADDPIWCDAPLVRTSCAIVVGYMASDLIIMTIHYKKVGEIFYLFHHGASVYAYYYVMTYGVLPYFANYRLLAEFSTPFVNQRWFLDALSYSKFDPVFMVNGIAMTATFFMVRIVSMPRYWHKVYSVYGTEPFLRLGHIRFVLVITCLVLDLINLFWFYKMCKGVRKVLYERMDKNRNIAAKIQ